ncbi:MAG TPA: TetR/AcrR family transcriptional regulator [Polyangiales bacterium]|nr:TetR/AcrR family transcriptional regulator [Polyangiales bacterium]
MDTRQRIVAEATRQLTRTGYAAFTIAAVRDALELSSGSMFHAFASKPALAAAVYVENMAEYQRSALAAIRRSSDPKRGICAWIAAHLGWIEDHRDVARYLFSTLPDDVMAEAAPALAEHNAAFYAALEQLFENAAAAGLMGRLERRVAQVICIGPAHEYGRQWTRGDVATPPRKLSRTLQRAALAGLAATRTARTAKEPS